MVEVGSFSFSEYAPNVIVLKLAVKESPWKEAMHAEADCLSRNSVMLEAGMSSSEPNYLGSF